MRENALLTQSLTLPYTMAGASATNESCVK